VSSSSPQSLIGRLGELEIERVENRLVALKVEDPVFTAHELSEARQVV